MASNNSFNSQDWRAEFIEVMFSDKSVWALVFYQSVMVVIFVAGVCFNLLSCAALWQAWRARAVDYYLLNLTAVDLVAAFGILLELNGYSHSPNDFEGLWDAVCKVHYLLLFTLFNTDILTVTALAIERYVAVFHPLLLNKNPGRRMRKIICSIWLIAILESVPEMMTVCLVQTQTVSVCVYVPTSHAKVANVVLSLATFAIPLGAMCLAYARLAGAVRRAQASHSSAAVFNHRNNSSKINKLIIALTASFLVCWLPFFVFRIMCTLDTHRSWMLQNYDILMMVALNSWFTIVLNPLLFGLLSTKFRNALKSLWNTKFKRRQSSSRNLVV